MSKFLFLIIFGKMYHLSYNNNSCSKHNGISIGDTCINTEEVMHMFDVLSK